MEYEVALEKAWYQLRSLSKEKNYSISFLNDEYKIDTDEKRILSLSCNAPSKSYVSILVLHYLICKLKGLPSAMGEWISFNELEGSLGYYSTFKKRVIEPILRKYGSNIDALLGLVERLKAKRIELADISVVIEPFDRVPILITAWRGDDEFGSEVNVLFDKSIASVFPSEDIVVLSEFVAHSI